MIFAVRLFGLGRNLVFLRPDLGAPLKMRFLCGSIVGDVLADPKHSLRSRGQLSSCMAYTLRCCVRRRLTTTEESLFLEAPFIKRAANFSQECVLNGGWEAFEVDSIDLLVGAPGPAHLQKGFAQWSYHLWICCWLPQLTIRYSWLLAISILQPKIFQSTGEL